MISANQALRLRPGLTQIVFLLSAAGALSGRANGAPDDPNQLAKLARGEIIVTRLPDDNPRILGGQAQATIDAPIERIWEILNDFNRYAEFLPRQVKSWIVSPEVLAEISQESGLSRRQAEYLLGPYRLDSVEGDTVYSYNVLDMPFPVSQRWYLLETVRDVEQYSLTWHQVTGNLRATTGSWQLEPLDDKTLATYTTRSDVGISVPGFLVNLGLNQTLPDVIKALRRRAEEPR